MKTKQLKKEELSRIEEDGKDIPDNVYNDGLCSEVLCENKASVEEEDIRDRGEEKLLKALMMKVIHLQFWVLAVMLIVAFFLGKSMF